MEIRETVRPYEERPPGGLRANVDRRDVAGVGVGDDDHDDAFVNDVGDDDHDDASVNDVDIFNLMTPFLKMAS